MSYSPFTENSFLLKLVLFGLVVGVESILTNLHSRWPSSLAIIKNTIKKLTVDTVFAYVCALFSYKKDFHRSCWVKEYANLKDF